MQRSVITKVKHAHGTLIDGRPESFIHHAKPPMCSLSNFLQHHSVQYAYSQHIIDDESYSKVGTTLSPDTSLSLEL